MEDAYSGNRKGRKRARPPGAHGAYIAALITHEHITAQHKSSAKADAKLEHARRIMDKVNEKQVELFYKKDH